MVRGFVGIGKFTGMGRAMAVGLGWIGKIYKIGGFGNDHGFVW
jgi:hypothetical protein